MMRSAPVVFDELAPGISFAQIDYARVIKAQGAVMVVNDADEDDETARQPLLVPAGDVILGFGPNASATRAATQLLAELGVRAISTVGQISTFAPFETVALVEAQATRWAYGAARDDMARALYAGRFVDSPLVADAPVHRLRALNASLIEETYGKYVARFKPSRFHRHPAGTDSTNVALTATEGVMLGIAADVCLMLGVSTALGVTQTGHRLSFAQDIADAFLLDVGIPVGFLVGAYKLKRADEIQSLIFQELHHYRLVPKMVELIHSALVG